MNIFINVLTQFSLQKLENIFQNLDLQKKITQKIKINKSQGHSLELCIKNKTNNSKMIHNQISHQSDDAHLILIKSESYLEWCSIKGVIFILKLDNRVSNNNKRSRNDLRSIKLNFIDFLH